jgi:hypothetical protein
MLLDAPSSDRILLLEMTKFRPSACRTSTSPKAAGDEIDHPDRGQIGNATTDVAALGEELAATVPGVERRRPSQVRSGCRERHALKSMIAVEKHDCRRFQAYCPIKNAHARANE